MTRLAASIVVIFFIVFLLAEAFMTRCNFYYARFMPIRSYLRHC